ncbi:3-keto-5-aminohexanoate cleavage protein [Streptomyces sp. NBC_00096]|uniref:3-keto-5-aminohexanoate cleavage protein n=1 Tax=Streptomyces sp. NBC_00096 TaxID=2975650 RepID=UPI00324E5856
MVSLNGSRSAADGTAVPMTPEDLVESALAAVAAGAGEVLVHPRTPCGRESLSPRVVGPLLEALRDAGLGAASGPGAHAETASGLGAYTEAGAGPGAHAGAGADARAGAGAKARAGAGAEARSASTARAGSGAGGETDTGAGAGARARAGVGAGAAGGSGLGVSVGVLAGVGAESGVAERLARVRSWVVLPDRAVVRFAEPGARELAELLLERGVGVDAEVPVGGAPGPLGRFLAWPVRSHPLVRLVLELPSADPGSIAGMRWLPPVPVLLFGREEAAWPVLRLAALRGTGARIGVGDVLRLPDGRAARSNAELVAAATRARREATAASR